MLRVLLLSVCAAAASGPAWAETVITGRVVDENNAAVPVASIRIVPASGSPYSPIQLLTNPAGGFTCRLPAPGRVVIDVRHAGFFPLENKNFDVTGTLPPITFVLNHVAEVLSTVQVSGQSAAIDMEQAQASKELNSLDLANLPYQGRDVAYTLKLLPNVLQDSNGGLHLSGSAVNQVMYSLDGFNITDPVMGTFNTRVNVDAVQSIEYSSSRYSPEFGKGSAGTVAIRTRMGSDVFHYNATNFVPGVDTASGLHIGTWSPRFDVSGPVIRKRMWFSESAQATYSQLVVEDLKGDNRIPTLKLDNLLRTQVNLTDTHQLFVSYLVNSTNSPRSGLSALDPYSTTVDRRARTWFVSLKQENYLKNGAVIEWGYAEDRTFSRLIPQGEGVYQITPFGKRGNFFVDSTQQASRQQAIFNVSPRVFEKAGAHRFKIGIDLDRLRYDVQNRRTGYELWGLGGYRLNRVTFEGPGVFSRPNAEAAWYAMDSWKLKPTITLELGLRQDWDELLRDPALSPRIAAAWSPFHWKHTKLAGGFAITRDPTSLDLFSRPLDQRSVTVNFDPEGNPATPAVTYFSIPARALKTPQYQNWTAGVEQRLPANIQLTVDYVRKRGQDGLTYLAQPNSDPAVNAIFALSNYGRDVFDSVETTVRQSFRKEYEWMASYTRSRALSNSVISLSVDEPLWITNNIGRMPWDSPNHFLSWGIFPTPLRDWSVAYNLDVRNGFPFSVVTDYGAIVGDVNSRRYPMYFDLDLHLERRLRVRNRLIAIRAGFNNITGHQNPSVVNNMLGAPGFLDYFGSQGRHLVFRLRWLGTVN